MLKYISRRNTHSSVVQSNLCR